MGHKSVVVHFTITVAVLVSPGRLLGPHGGMIEEASGLLADVRIVVDRLVDLDGRSWLYVCDVIREGVD
jgi:hypothetical protein